MDIAWINPVALFSPVLLGLLLLEIVFSYLTDREVYSLKDFLANLSLGAGAYLITASLKVGSAAYLFQVCFRMANTGTAAGFENFLGHESFGWGWHTWLACLILVDFSHYWVHRFNHTVRVMWAAHVVHHSSEHYNLGTGLRISWIALLYKPLFYLWLPILGFRPEMILVCIGIESVWQYVLHTEYCPKLGVLEWIFVTPRQHMVHHGRNQEYIDKNHGAIFNVFDRLFGTWREFDEQIEIDYGVTAPPNSYNPAVIVLHEYRAIWRDVMNAGSPRDRLMYIFGPPGWSPQPNKGAESAENRETPASIPAELDQSNLRCTP